MKSRLIIYSVVVLIAGLVVSVLLTLHYKKKVQHLQTEFLTVDSTNVVTVVKVESDRVTSYAVKEDSKEKIVIKVIKKVPEGYVKFDMREYYEVQKKLARLQEKIKQIRDVGESDDEATIDSLELIVDELKEWKIEPIASHIQEHGWLFSPSLGIGIGRERKLTPAIGVKFWFRNRFNIGVYATLDLIGIGLGYHISRFLPLFERTELRLISGIGYTGKFNVWCGLTTDL